MAGNGSLHAMEDLCEDPLSPTRLDSEMSSFLFDCSTTESTLVNACVNDPFLEISNADHNEGQGPT